VGVGDGLVLCALARRYSTLAATVSLTGPYRFGCWRHAKKRRKRCTAEGSTDCDSCYCVEFWTGWALFQTALCRTSGPSLRLRRFAYGIRAAFSAPFSFDAFSLLTLRVNPVCGSSAVSSLWLDL